MAQNSNELYTVLPNVKKGVADVGSKIYTNLQLEDLPNEVWVDVYGYDGIYEVSNLGRVKSLERYVSNGRGGEMFVKERILKQSFIGKEKKRVSVSFCINNIAIKQEINTVVFYSFNPELLSNNKGKEVCHLNKNGLDNRLINLSLLKISNSKKIAWKLGVNDNCYKEYERRKEVTNKLKHKICSVCNKKKSVKNFERGRTKCMKCKGLESYNNKLKKLGKKRVNNTKIYITDTVTKEVFVSTNKNECVISKQLINRYANTKKLVIPYRNSKHINPLLVEIKQE